MRAHLSESGMGETLLSRQCFNESGNRAEARERDSSLGDMEDMFNIAPKGRRLMLEVVRV